MLLTHVTEQICMNLLKAATCVFGAAGSFFAVISLSDTMTAYEEHGLAAVFFMFGGIAFWGWRKASKQLEEARLAHLQEKNARIRDREQHVQELLKVIEKQTRELDRYHNQNENS